MMLTVGSGQVIYIVFSVTNFLMKFTEAKLKSE
jgi:hypothetical protein